MNFKHTTRLLAFSLFGLLCFSNTSYGQSTKLGQATIPNPKHIELLGSSQVHPLYQADITLLNFQSQEQANRFFARITDNLLSYQVDLNTNQVTIRIQPTRVPPTWTLADWNNYINNKLANL